MNFVPCFPLSNLLNGNSKQPSTRAPCWALGREREGVLVVLLGFRDLQLGFLPTLLTPTGRQTLLSARAEIKTKCYCND